MSKIENLSSDFPFQSMLLKDLVDLKQIKNDVITRLGHGDDAKSAAEVLVQLQAKILDPTCNNQAISDLIFDSITILDRISSRFEIKPDGIVFKPESLTIFSDKHFLSIAVPGISLQAAMHAIKTTLFLDRDGLILMNILATLLARTVNNAEDFTKGCLAIIEDVVFIPTMSKETWQSLENISLDDIKSNFKNNPITIGRF